MNTRFFFYHVIAVLVVGIMLLTAVDLSAQDHDLAVTISPFHLTYPVVELTGEYRARDKVGVAGILGVGSSGKYSIFEIGAQTHYYLLGDFEHGMQLGGELLYVNVSGDDVVDDIDIDNNGLSLGAFTGYKIAADFGLTANVQAGVATVVIRGNAEDSAGNTGSGSDKTIMPLININIGWSF